MRRGWVISILILMFLAGGLVCLSLDRQTVLERMRTADFNEWSGLMLFVLAGSVGLIGAIGLTLDHRRLVGSIHEMVAQGRAGGIMAPSGDLMPLTQGINDLIQTAQRTMAEAELKVKELEIQLKVATAERQHAEAILYSISDAVLVTDPYDELLLANDAAAKTFDFDLTQSSRQPIQEVLHEPKIVELIREMRQSDSRSGRRVVEYQMQAGQSSRSFMATLSCVADHADLPAGVVVVLHDVTREKEVAQMKNDFVSNVSHELRTPLASIKAYVEMLIDDEANDEKTRREFYEIIQNESNRLGRLIDNILNISRIESGLVKINKQPLSLTVIMKEAIEVIAPQAQLKNIRIEEQLSPLFYQTLADKDMLYQAVLNLLSNAVKYTPEGGKIIVQAQVDEAKGKVVGRVSDTGVGIPPKDLPFVFDKFYRAEANNQMAKGTGLGLALFKQIIETVHHGRIFAESAVGQGSTFGFELGLCE